MPSGWLEEFGGAVLPTGICRVVANVGEVTSQGTCPLQALAHHQKRWSLGRACATKAAFDPPPPPSPYRTPCTATPPHPPPRPFSARPIPQEPWDNTNP